MGELQAWDSHGGRSEFMMHRSLGTVAALLIDEPRWNSSWNRPSVANAARRWVVARRRSLDSPPAQQKQQLAWLLARAPWPSMALHGPRWSERNCAQGAVDPIVTGD